MRESMTLVNLSLAALLAGCLPFGGGGGSDGSGGESGGSGGGSGGGPVAPSSVSLPGNSVSLPGNVTCTPPITAATNTLVTVPSGDTCFVEADVNGDFRVFGTFVLTAGRTINGNIELFGGSLIALPGSRIKGNIKGGGTVELNGAAVEGNLEFESSPAVLVFAGGRTRVKGNLEFKSMTTVAGAADATIDGNAKCGGHVVDGHSGIITTTGKKENCPPGL